MGHRVGLLGTFGNGNLGDSATVEAVLSYLKGAGPEWSAVGFSANPEDTRDRCGIPCFAISRHAARPAPSSRSEGTPDIAIGPGPGSLSWTGRLKRLVPGPLRRALSRLAIAAKAVPGEIAFARESRKHLEGLDCLIITGGGQLIDNWGGPWGHPWTLLLWSLLCRRAGVPLVFLNVGASELVFPLSRVFLRIALSSARYRSFRDENSRARARRWGAPEPDHVLPDLAFSFPTQGIRPDPTGPGRPMVVVNAMAYCDPHGWNLSDPAAYSGYVGKIAGFCRRLVADGYRVDLVPSQAKTDPAANADILARVRGDLPEEAHRWVSERRPAGVAELLSIFSAAEFIVASRFHGVILALCAGKPVIALSYEDKMDVVMSRAGLSGYTLAIDGFTEASLLNAFAGLVSGSEEIRKRISAHVAGNRLLLEGQYRLVFGAGAGIFHI
ncbi:MAG: colanic acid biosynthesis protein [Fibrobacteres bacterium]|nr:colanic acid biosynthesis protein [Fibrobacterota bacterium]